MKSLFFCLCLLMSAQTWAQDPLPFLEERIELFKHKYPDLHLYTPEEIAILAQKIQEHAAASVNLDKPLRLIEAKAIVNTLALLQSKNCKFFFRHGEQARSNAVKALPAPLQKIAMMRLPENKTDPLTMESAAELLGTLVVLDYLKQKTKLHFEIETSSNKRASDVASAMAIMLAAKEKTNPVWDCINYPPESKMPATELLEILPDGTLPWEEGKVDTVVGKGTYENMNLAMKNELARQVPEGSAFIAITHTQQLNALELLSGAPMMRIQNFGFLFVGDSKSTLFSSGFYTK